MKRGRKSCAFLCLLLAASLFLLALPPERAAAAGWVQVARRGISENYNRTQYGASCSAVLDSMLYVGTEEHIAYGIGCQVWGWDGSEWSRASDEGFGDPDNEAVSAIAAYDSTLYAGTFNLYGCQVWRHDGPGPGDWTLINVPGFGLRIQKLDSFAVYDDGNGERLYAEAGGGVWRWDGPGTADWTQVNEDGFGSGYNTDAPSMATFGGGLYAATYNDTLGCEVWMLSSSWTVDAWVSGGGGTVDPATQEVDYGSPASINLQPYPGYHVQSITDNGAPAEIADPYSIDQVTGDHEVEVTFAPDVIPATTWYLAEGCTEGGFETFVLVQNPGGDPVTVDLDFMTPSGPLPGPRSYPIGANSRHTFRVNDYLTDWSVSTKVTATGEVICERAMYGGNRTWGHDSIGYAP